MKTPLRIINALGSWWLTASLFLPLYIGVVLALSGLCALLGRFFWYEREVALLVHDGKILIGARDEFFKKWGVERFQKSTDSLAPRNLA